MKLTPFQLPSYGSKWNWFNICSQLLHVVKFSDHAFVFTITQLSVAVDAGPYFCLLETVVSFILWCCPLGGGGFLPFTVYTFHSLLFTSDSCLDLNHFKSHLRDICFSDIYLSTISLNYNYPLDIIPSISNRQISYKHLLVHIRTLWVDLELSENFSSTLAHPLSNHSPPSKQRTSLETKFR